MSTSIYTKKCTKCHEIKSFDEFCKNKNGKYGLRGNCKQCHRQYRIENKDKIKQYKKQYNIDNKDKIKEYDKQYHIEHKDIINEDQKQYRKSFALYETYVHQLTIDEDPRLSDDGSSLEVKCKYCGKYFKPTNSDVKSRIKSINGKGTGENSLYCSDGCKKSCGTYKKKKYPEGFKINTSREVQPALRKLVLEMDNWKCQKCDSGKELHCHHYEGIEVNPVESADIDICITLCKKCHRLVHKQDGCNMKREKC